tara:strand:+ start:1019 stop:1261 length:243 start_codon:yes stop_codon:yes gene_type:complete
MRVRHIAALTVAVLVAGVVTFQAVTATPPQPYVRLIGDGRPNAPWNRFECRNGEVVGIYTTSHGAELEPAPTGRSCVAAD